MYDSLHALLSFTGWTLLLGLGVILFRVSQVLAGKKKSNEFPAWIQHGSDFYWRLNRAHLNCLENLPVFAVLVFAGAILDPDQAIFDLLAWIVFAARILQTCAHLSGGGVWPVNVRFTGFFLQYVSFGSMLLLLLKSLP
ncbi:MAPEG family protein [Leptospira fletcheri]|uniref:MAPEG family protein n=1 Tax=Leptospira fletcheri TaxID=2484981 RepID=A0A4R9GIX8_9LEPT|nr:MAPEG family protein [Leptospira fletcheri]TGK12106.1 MAPEG family protein [Leptospira fletcheri]